MADESTGKHPATSHRTPALMVLGTASHVGKSLLTAALCRILAGRGYRVAPFKAQNMSLNSAATPEGLEIGRAQALQAEAAGIAPSVHMNPVLIKPTGMRSSQVIVQGKVWKQIQAADYYENRAAELLPRVRDSYETLAAGNDVLVLEGAGSPAEINLRASDIVNMRMAELADAACILVGDIDRGGVFASILGTLELLEPEDRRRIRGFAINKFRGDVNLLWPGIRMLEERVGIPCVGVVNYIPGITLEEEDSAGIAETHAGAWSSASGSDRPLRIAIVALPWISNFTDFDALAGEPCVELRFCRSAADLAAADVVILPGTKQTADDLQWLRAQGFEGPLQRHAASGRLVVGICGGMQMLGHEIIDPHGMESGETVQGFGLLPIRTTMQPAKVTQLASGRVNSTAMTGFLASMSNTVVHGYEIHLGETEYLDGAPPFALIQRSTDDARLIEDGCISKSGNAFGTYLHGIFDHDAFRHAFLAVARSDAGLAPASHWTYREQERAAQWQLLAGEVSRALDLERIFGWLDLPASAAMNEVAS